VIACCSRDIPTSAVVIPGATANSDVTIVLPGSTTTDGQPGQDVTVTTTPVSSDSVVRSESHFKIRGSRTSTQPFAAFNSYSAIPPLTPLVPTASATATPIATPIILVP